MKISFTLFGYSDDEWAAKNELKFFFRSGFGHQSRYDGNISMMDKCDGGITTPVKN